MKNASILERNLLVSSIAGLVEMDYGPECDDGWWSLFKLDT